MEDIVKLLEPFKNATEVLNGQKYPTLSCLAPILKDLRDKLAINADDSNVVMCGIGFWQSVFFRYDNFC